MRASNPSAVASNVVIITGLASIGTTFIAIELAKVVDLTTWILGSGIIIILASNIISMILAYRNPDYRMLPFINIGLLISLALIILGIRIFAEHTNMGYSKSLHYIACVIFLISQILRTIYSRILEKRYRD